MATNASNNTNILKTLKDLRIRLVEVDNYFDDCDTNVDNIKNIIDTNINSTSYSNVKTLFEHLILRVLMIKDLTDSHFIIMTHLIDKIKNDVKNKPLKDSLIICIRDNLKLYQYNWKKNSDYRSRLYKSLGLNSNGNINPEFTFSKINDLSQIIDNFVLKDCEGKEYKIIKKFNFRGKQYLFLYKLSEGNNNSFSTNGKNGTNSTNGSNNSLSINSTNGSNNKTQNYTIIEFNDNIKKSFELSNSLSKDNINITNNNITKFIMTGKKNTANNITFNS